MKVLLFSTLVLIGCDAQSLSLVEPYSTPTFIFPVPYDSLATTKPKILPGQVSPKSIFETPAFEPGFGTFRIASCLNKAWAETVLKDFRMEVQVRDLSVWAWPKMKLSPWNVNAMVIPDFKHRYSIVIRNVHPHRMASFCEWLRTDVGPFGVDTDGTKWSAWPSYVTRPNFVGCKPDCSRVKDW